MAPAMASCTNDEKPVDSSYESSGPNTAATPVDGNSIISPETGNENPPSIAHPFINRFRILAVFLLNLANGLNDSAAGALIPSIEEYSPPSTFPFTLSA